MTKHIASTKNIIPTDFKTSLTDKKMQLFKFSDPHVAEILMPQYQIVKMVCCRIVDVGFHPAGNHPETKLLDTNFTRRVAVRVHGQLRNLSKPN